MKKTILSIFLLILIVGQTNAQKTGKFSIDLTADAKYTNVKVQIYDITASKKKVLAEEKLQAGKLKKEYNIKGNNIYILEFEKKEVLLLAVNPGEKLIIDYKGKDNVTIKGSKGSNAIINCKKKKKELTKKYGIESLNKEYKAASDKKDQEKIKEITAKYTILAKKMDKEFNEYLYNELGTSVAWVLFGQSLNDNTKVSFLEKLVKKLEKEVPLEAHTKMLSKRINGILNTAVGKFAPEISLPNQNGIAQKLSSLKGKYVLIDFWASWCGPCRKENPNVVKAYNAYKDKGFEIFGVSLDESKEKWIKAISKDQLNWTNVSDLKGWASEAGKAYGVKGIPMNLLLDKEGKIIAKNLRGEALDAKLKEILK